MSNVNAPSVTIVGHDASRTGAPVLLASLLRWLQSQGVDRVRAVLLGGGPLVRDYRRSAPTRVLTSSLVVGAGHLDAAARSVGRPLSSIDPVLRFSLRHEPSPDIVVANTLASLVVARVLANGRRGRTSRLVCHVHELDSVAVRLLPARSDECGALLGSVDQFIAAGVSVQSMLVERFAVPADRVAVVDEFIERPDPSFGAEFDVRRELSIGVDQPLLLDVGAMGRRKGPERFVDLMATLADHERRPIGVWLGGAPDSAVWSETVGDAMRSGAADSIRLVPTVEDPARYVVAADVLVSTAIEDPYPLAVLEAGALGVPVVGFESGGLNEVLGACAQGDAVCGIGDVLAMSAAVQRLLEDEVLRVDRGRRLSEWVMSTHLVEHLAPVWWKAVCG